MIFNKILHIFLCLLPGIIYSCSKLDVNNSIEFETNIKADSIVFAVIGDFGKAGGPEEEVANMVKSWDPDFIITTGDNNYETGSLKTIKKNISDYYGDYIYNFDAPVEYQCKGKAFNDGVNRFFPSPGNHDAYFSKNLDPYLSFFTLPERETYYHFIWGPVSFYSLNSVTGNRSEQKKWLTDLLSQSGTPYNVVYFHHSPYTTGPHGNDEGMQWDFFSLNADIVMTGHDHIYSRIEKRDEEGMYYIVNGSGGKSLYDCESGRLPEDEFQTYCYDIDYGAIKVTATYNKLLMEFYAISQPENPLDQVEID